MKLSLILLGSLLASSLYAKDAAMICSSYHYRSVKKIAEAKGDHDKFKHCAISCLLALRCPAFDVLELGVIKELADLVGPGSAEMADLEADYYGVSLVTSSKVKTDESCLKKCQKKYPENSCSEISK